MDNKKVKGLANVGVAAGGGLLVGTGLKLAKKPIMSFGTTVALAVLAVSAKNEKVKAAATGGAVIAAISSIGDIADKIPVLGEHVPQLSGAEEEVWQDPETGIWYDQNGEEVEVIEGIAELPEHTATSDVDMIL